MLSDKIKGIRNGIYEDTGLMTVDAELMNVKELPDEYYSYKVSNIDLEDRQDGAILRYKSSSNNPEFEDNLKEDMYLDGKFIISFSSYSPDLNKARSNAIKLWTWFKYRGRDRLKQGYLDIVVVNLGDIQDRTTTLYDHYDYKYGFDVEFRTLIRISREIDSIETYKVEGEVRR